MKYGLLLLVCLVSFACNQNSSISTDEYPKHVQLARFQKPDGNISKVSSVAKSIEYIALETNDNCLIGLTSNITSTADGV